MQGINNLGSTCAINSLIQMICRCDKLRNIILNSNTPEGTFTAELKEVIDLMYNQNKSLNPVKFINNFYITFKGIFNRFEQIDINELWLYFFDKINSEISRPYINNSDSVNELINKTFNENKTSDLLELVQGSFINIIKCNNCHHQTHTFEPFININVDIDEKNITVADLIMNTIKDEFRNKDEWICDKCNGNHSYYKLKRIYKLPSILFITINRFIDIYNKNNKEIYINEELNFNKGTILSVNEDNIYKLKSIGLHYGNLMGGHYMAVCKIEDKYYIYNDEQIVVQDNYELKSNYAYLIIYEF